jgi:glutamate synthase (NADPH/NADH) large chain
MVDLDPFADEDDIAAVHDLISRHAALTGSAVAARVLAAWPSVLSQFVVVMPRDYKRVRAASAPPRAQEVPAWVDRLGA